MSGVSFVGNYLRRLDPLETKYGLPVISGADLNFVDPFDSTV